MRYIRIAVLCFCVICPAYAAGDIADHTVITPQVAKDLKIGVTTAGPGTVHQTISLTGKITLNKNRVAQVRARFPGLVRDIQCSIGDMVKKGQTLATVESNQSLQAYAVTSPLDGIILGRNTNIGDTADTEPLFVVADLKQLWAEFFIFSRDMKHIKPGQLIRIRSLTDDTETETTLSNLLPTTESSSQTVITRVDLDNTDDTWRAGMTVRGDVIMSERHVPIAIKTNAVQRQNDQNVIYIQNADRYEVRKIDVGQSDRDWTEVLNGLQPGEIYVSENSFIIKADIEKSQANHEH